MNDQLLYRKLFAFLFIVYISSFIVANAQTRKIDSLFAVFKTEKDDTNKVINSNNLSWQLFLESNYRMSDLVARKALQLSESLKYDRGLEDSYKTIGVIYAVQGHYQEAMEYLQKSLKIAQKIGDKEKIAAIYANMGHVDMNKGDYVEALKSLFLATDLYKKTNNKSKLENNYINLGNVYFHLGNYPEALKYYLQGLNLGEETNNKYGLAINYEDVGSIYAIQTNYSESSKYYLKALKIYTETSNKQGICNVYTNIGNNYEKQNNSADALKYYQQALSLSAEIGDIYTLELAYNHLGEIYFIQQNYSEALKDYFKCLELARSADDRENLSSAYCNIGKTLAKHHNYIVAAKYLDSGLVISKKIGNKNVLVNIYRNASIIDSAMNNYKAAFTDYKNYTIYKDSLNNDDYTKKITQEQMQYEFDKKQTEEKAEQNKKDVMVLADKKKQHIITGFISGGLILVLASLGLLFSRFKVTQKQKKIIERQKSEVERQKTLVEEKNKDIIDSITYAKRLQSAILPPISLVKQFFPESFILYKPKDIVAGDFYWMQRLPRPAGEGRGEVILIAAADCTGHGVPGAMVSVVCSNAINRIVKETEVRDTGSVLDNVRNVVLETFSTSEGEVKDGMDISFCAINRQANILEWTGANNPLWYIHKNKLIEIAPDKQPVGIQDNPKPFTTHLVNIEKGDIIYLFTDGYADQFGGPKGKKFKYKQLQEKLLAIAHLTMEEQKKALEETLETWKGSLEQVDDILVMGIRI
jgi:tetratricopeptide (TPR) repeat protein